MILWNRKGFDLLDSLENPCCDLLKPAYFCLTRELGYLGPFQVKPYVGIDIFLFFSSFFHLDLQKETVGV